MNSLVKNSKKKEEEDTNIAVMKLCFLISKEKMIPDKRRKKLSD